MDKKTLIDLCEEIVKLPYDQKVYKMKNIEHVLYVPYQEKVNKCKFVVEKANYINGRYTPDTTKEYVLYVMTIINAYYSFEIDFDSYKDVQEIFDIFAMYKFIDLFLAPDEELYLIPPKEIERFNSIMKMVKDDTISKEESIVRYIDNKFVNLGIILNSFSSQILDSLNEQIQSVVSKEDLGIDDDAQEKILQFLNQLKVGETNEQYKS